ncbi:MAG: hypothetical protein RH982_08980 [Parvibaculum sp.]
MVASGICNTFLNFKEQLIGPAKNQHDTEVQRRLKYLASLEKRPELKTVPYELITDFHTFECLSPPTDILQNLAFEKISLNGRPLVLSTILAQTETSINAAIGGHRDLCHFFKENSPWDPDVLAPAYLGIPDKDGHQDRRYALFLKSISEKTDDGIWFSNLLCKDLIKHGEKLRRDFGKTAPQINKVDFSDAEKKGLIPDFKAYKTWLTHSEIETIEQKVASKETRVGKEATTFGAAG